MAFYIKSQIYYHSSLKEKFNVSSRTRIFKIYAREKTCNKKMRSMNDDFGGA